MTLQERARAALAEHRGEDPDAERRKRERAAAYAVQFVLERLDVVAMPDTATGTAMVDGLTFRAVSVGSVNLIELIEPCVGCGKPVYTTVYNLVTLGLSLERSALCEKCNRSAAT